MGFNLGHALKKAGCRISQVISSTYHTANTLAKELDAIPGQGLSALKDEADLTVLAIPDEALTNELHHMPRITGILVHTSGSVDMNTLTSRAEKIGVLYPYQTFSKERRIGFKHIPVFIESNSPYVRDQLEVVARQLSDEVHELDSLARRSLHLAGVFACNFPNYLIGVAQKILVQQKIDPQVLLPLVKETVNKLADVDAFSAQSGPAKRDDQETIKKHLDLLSCYPVEQKVYRLLSEIITELYTDNSKPKK